MDINNHIASIIARVLNDEANTDEKAELDNFLMEDPEHARQFEILRKVWLLNEGSQPFALNGAIREDSEILERIKAKAVIERENQEVSAVPVELIKLGTKSLWVRVAKYAATVLVLLGVGAVVFKKNKADGVTEASITIKEIAVENGSRKRVMLPDGSTVLLNSGSRIEYNAQFQNKNREVVLWGEAFFDVVKNAESPFIVHTGNIDIKVLGTSFNVKSYADDKTIETTLIHGLVEIKNNAVKDAQPIFLHPNEKVSFARQEGSKEDLKGQSTHSNKAINQEGEVTLLDSLAKDKEWVETAWIYNRLEFRKNSFEDIAKKMERWYGVKITISDIALAKQNFTGSFENETLEQALKALQKTTSFTFKINNNEVFINASK